MKRGIFIVHRSSW